MLIDVNEETLNFLNTKVKVILKGGMKYYYFPVWYRLNRDGTIDEFMGESIPPELSDLILVQKKV